MDRTFSFSEQSLSLGETLAVESKQDTTNNLLTTISVAVGTVVDTPEFFEDTAFIAGDSPVTLDINTALGRNATDVLILNDGVGDFTYAVSNNGSVFGDEITLKRREFKRYSSVSIDSIRITHTGTDSAYRVEAI